MSALEVEMTSSANGTGEQDVPNGTSCNMDDLETVPVTIEYGEEENGTVVKFSFKRLLMFAGTPRPCVALEATTHVLCSRGPAARRLPVDGSLLVYVDSLPP